MESTDYIQEFMLEDTVGSTELSSPSNDGSQNATNESGLVGLRQ